MKVMNRFLHPVLGGALVLILLVVSPVYLLTLKTQQEALEQAFPAPLKIGRKTVFLTDAQLTAIREQAGKGVEVSSKLIVYYEALGEQGVTGYAYFDSHRVRTMNETVMVLVQPDGTLERVEVLSFFEPPDYLPPQAWLDHLVGRKLNPRLAAGRDVLNITGATMTARAITAAIRRVLAIHRVLHPGAISAGGQRP